MQQLLQLFKQFKQHIQQAVCFLPSDPFLTITMTTHVTKESFLVLSGAVAPVQGQQFVIPAPSSQIMQGGGSDQNAG